ncbi:MAG: DUF192 domain-containing protein [Tepidibacillus sp.]
MQIKGKEYVVADTFWKRFIGLMGKKKSEGLYLTKTNQIHTCFMRFSLDVYYINEKGKVIAIDCGMKPWRFGRRVKQARDVLEVPACSLPHLTIGDYIK